MDELQAKGIGFRSVCEAIDTTTAVGRMYFQMLAVFAEFERNLISERTKAGLKAARARGHRGGRKIKVDAKKLKMAKAMLADPTVTLDEVAKTLQVGRSSIYRALEREKTLDNLKAARKAAKQARKVADRVG